MGELIGDLVEMERMRTEGPHSDTRMKSLHLARFSVEKRVTITMLMLIIVVFGVLSLSRLGLEMMPDITFPMCTVMAQYPGVAPEEVERLVTEPLEGVIAGVNGVKRITSTSAEGVSAILVEFDWGTAIDLAGRDIKDNIDFIRDYLPDEMHEPVVFKFDLNQIPIMFMGVSGIENTYRLRKFLEDNVVERLQRLEGVAQAAVFGGDKREIQVALNPAKLKYRGLSIDNVVRSLGAQNLNTPAGYLSSDQTDFLLRSVGEFRSVDDIRNAVAGYAADGTPIRLADVGEVHDTFAPSRSVSRMDGKESVFLVLRKRSGANTLKVSQRLKKELNRLKTEYPGISMATIFDQGEPVERVTSSTSSNAAVGGLLALVFMWVFLASLRPTLAIGVAIPLSVITTFIALYLAGFSLNLMTLGGLALGVGMLVDNAVVVIENMYRHLQEGKSRKEAAITGASEVAGAITTSTMTTVVVFLPILFSQGLASMLSRGLSLAILFSLLSSLLVALTIVPMLGSVLFKEKTGASRAHWFDAVRDFYGRILGSVLHRPGMVLAAAFALFAITVFAGTRLVGTEFMPESDSPMLMLNAELPIGTTLEESERISGKIREMISAMPEILSLGEVIGRSEDDRGGDQAEVTGPHVVQIYCRLRDSEDRERTAQQVQDAIRLRLPELRDTRYRFISMGAFGQQTKPVQIMVYGRDLDALREICGTISQVVASVPGIADVETSFSRGRPEYHVAVDRGKALQYGLAPGQIQMALKTANLGTIATRFRTGEDEVNVRVILDERFRQRLEQLEHIPLTTPSGAVVPLGQLVKFTKAEGPTVIRRHDQFRVGIVDANLSGRALGPVVKDVRTLTARFEKSLPDGYSISYKGQFEDMMESFGQLGLAFLLAALLIYMVMAAQFESLVHPFVIMFTIPLAALGVVAALWIFGKTLSVVSFLGVIILAGIVVNNGIVLIDYVNQLRARGAHLTDALVQAGKTRLRPIVITAGTTIFGMLPMAFSVSEGSELRTPLALTVIGGLLSATVLTLFVIPAAYIYAERIGGRFKRGIKKVIG